MEKNLEDISELLLCKSRETCCVHGCKSIRRNNRNISFHRFPKENQLITVKNDFGDVYEEDRRKLWEVRLKMGKKVTKTMTVCSRHFKKEDYHSTGCFDKRRLLPNAVPSENLPLSTFKKKLQEKRSSRLKRIRNCTPPVLEDSQVNSTIESDEFEVTDPLISLPETDTSTEKIIDIGTQTENSFYLLKTTDNQTNGEYNHSDIQVKSEVFYDFSESISSEKELNRLTGLNSFALLNMLVTIFTMVKPDTRIHRLSDKSQVLLTFLKLKLDLPYVVLGTLFKISPQACKQIFVETVKILSKPLKEAIIFPGYEHIQRTLPKCFKDFSNVRIILKCTEILVQKPKKLCCRIKLNSSYKGTTTVKFMTGVAPSGLITFVSLGFGGRTSDKYIFESSNLLPKLTKDRDEVMVHKGSHIKDLCDEYSIKVIQPTFLRKKSKLSENEALINNIIERSNQRIKLFKILSNRLPFNLMTIIDDIFLIACAITNLTNPILGDEEFL